MNIRESFLAVMAAAKVTQGELARACGISRVLVNKYCNDKYKVSRVTDVKVRIEKTLEVIDSLIKSGKLPLADGKTKEQRLAAMDRIKAFVAAS